MAKNIITVGHIDSFYNLPPLSSKGPAFDGRVKPELVAFGEDGSSGAAAMVSGTAALLQNAYKQTHNNVIPSSQLVKAILLNSADDVGAGGIDYSAGYGSLNAYRALQAITKNYFFEGEVKNSQTSSFSFSIPVNTENLKILLCWTDTPAVANAGKALVNDLDISLKSVATGETWLPWVLSNRPNKDSLSAAPVRKKDTLNTVEQITIDQPPPGEYVIEVKGSKLITETQQFALAYQIDTANFFLWSYPSSTDVLTADVANVLRWQTNITGDAAIEYSVDGNFWQPITSTAELGKKYYKWNVPGIVSKLQLRLKPLANPFQFISDTFVVSKPQNIKVGFNCVDSFLLFWNKLPADKYRLYQLGQKYMEPFIDLPDTAVVLKKNQHPSLFYSVTPLINDKEGLRSGTVNYTTQGVECYLRSFLASVQNNTGALTAQIGTIYNIASVSFQKINGGDTQTIKTFSEPVVTSFSYNDPVLVRGVNKYRVAIRQKDGTVLYSGIEAVNYFPDLPVIVFPNPALQNQPINIIVREPFVYSIQVYDVMGRLIRFQQLSDLNNQLQPLVLSKGIYFMKILSESGKLTTQKLLVQ